MKVVMTAHDRQSAREDRSAILDRLIVELQAKLPAADRPLFSAFANLLAAATPAHLLNLLPDERLAELLLALFRHLQQRTEPVHVACLPVLPKRCLLVSNCPDAPHLLLSLQLLLGRQRLHYRLVAHPILRIGRSPAGGLVAVGSPGAKAGDLESFMIIDIEGLEPDAAAQLLPSVRGVLDAVLTVNAARRPIADRLRHLATVGDLNEFQPLLEWLADGNADFFAARTLRLDPAKISVQSLAGSETGLIGLFLADLSQSAPLADCPETLRAFLQREPPVGIELLDRRSPLVREERLIYLGVREPAPDGSWLEHSFIGLPAERNVRETVLQVPRLRDKIERALADLHIPVGSYDYEKILSIFNTYPKIELFMMPPAAVCQAVRSLSLIYRQGRVTVIPVPQAAIRGLTLLLVMPKTFYSDAVLTRMENYISRSCQGAPAASRVIHLADDYLSLHVNLRPRQDLVRLDLDRLEQGLTHLAEPWPVRLHRLLDRGFGPREGDRLLQLYGEAFPPEYRQLIHPRFAVRDIPQLEAVRRGEGEKLALWGPFQARGGFCRLQFYSLQENPLNDLMPFLENLNLTVLDENDFALRCAGTRLYIKSFSVRNSDPEAPELHTLRPLLLDALNALRSGRLENDYLNRLLVLTGLDWRQIDIFRGYRNYLFQLGTPFSKRRVAFALINHPRIAVLLYRYFEARFLPRPEWSDVTVREEQGLMPLRQQLAEALEQVTDINEDSILRGFFNLIDSTVRTNFFRRQGLEQPYFSFKISAIGIIDMPAPRPLYEIYVHSARMEGIHLRGGRVARGGIRWSDRPDDFRTEILGLMKTQMTKNALIVPVGSKGGFVIKGTVPTREAGLEMARDAYCTLMRGLLDLTDNRSGGSTVPPEQVICYDEPDPYLVVAADKGTAHLPDTANAVAAEYGFWLGDAFASGGSRGYDHKALGITARGAWESVKRHFREMGRDVQREPFTVVGIGDMSGDVFGNGMLLSRQILLRAAFDHRHIFIDPNPDPETGFAERKRLYDLPRSSWDDYDRTLISPGGGVWPRTAKDIPLSEPVRQWLGLRQTSLDGQSLIRRLLAAEVDLLWNGGIGTYVKASTQGHETVGDRANDGVRIDATELRARVVGEGGNLGMTQLARIEYARLGGRLYTDAIDNSAGVDCSDHEVNLKIFMQYLAETGAVASLDERDALLRGLTDDVCLAVLRHNTAQTGALALDDRRCRIDSEPFITLVERLVRAGLLDRRGESLPARREVLAREDCRFYLPELAVLLAYSKMHLYTALLEAQWPERLHADSHLMDYFPKALREQFAARLPMHPLAREIAATVMTNTVVDQAGSTFILGIADRTGASPLDIVTTYLDFDAALAAPVLRRALTAAPFSLAAEEQYRLLLRLEGVLAALVESALDGADKSAPPDDGSLAEPLQNFLRILPGVLPVDTWGACRSEIDALRTAGIDEEASRTLVLLPWLDDFMPISRLAAATGQEMHLVTGLFRDVRARLDIPLLLQRLAEVPMRDSWDRAARRGLQARFHQGVVTIVDAICRRSDCNPDAYFALKRTPLRSWQGLLVELRQSPAVNLHPMAVLADALETFYLS